MGQAAGLFLVLQQVSCGGTSERAQSPADVDRLDVPRLDAGASSSTDAEGGVRFGHPAAAVGTITTIVVHAASVAPDDVDGTQASSYDSSLTVTVLALDGPVASRVRVVFARNVQTYQGTAKPTVIDGKTYEVASLAGEVLDDQGMKVSADESQRVLDVVPDLGARARLDESLPERAMRIGDRRDEVATAILRLVHPRAWASKAAEAKLLRVEGDVAIFGVHLEAGSQSGMAMTIDGEASVRLADASLAHVRLAGGYRHPNGDPPGTIVYERTVTTSAAASRSAR